MRRFRRSRLFRVRSLLHKVVAVSVISASSLIAPATASSAIDIDSGSGYYCEASPCLDSPRWNVNTNVITVHVEYAGYYNGFDFSVSDNWGNWHPANNRLPDANGNVQLSGLPYRTYTITAVGCLRLYFVAPICSGESSPVTISTVPTRTIKTYGPVHLQFGHSGKCLDVPNMSTRDNTPLDQWDCVSSLNEGWFIDMFDATTYRIRNAWSGKCVNVAGGGYAWRTPIIQWTCGNYLNEYFKSLNDPGSNTPPGDFRWISPAAVTSSPVLNVDGGGMGNGARIILWGKGPFPNEYVRSYEDHNCTYNSPSC